MWRGMSDRWWDKVNPRTPSRNRPSELNIQPLLSSLWSISSALFIEPDWKWEGQVTYWIGHKDQPPGAESRMVKRGDWKWKSQRKLSDTERIKHKPSLSPVFPSSADTTTIHTNPEVKILRVTLHSSSFLLLHPYQIQIQCRYLTNLMSSLQLYYHYHDLNSHDVSLRPLE